MQVFPQQLLGLPVISLQTGQTVAITSRLVIDPDRLCIVALECTGHSRMPLLLLPADIRQLAPQGVLVDSDDSLAEAGDIVRVAPLLEKPFNPIGIRVVTELGRTVGKLEDFTIALNEFMIQKLHVRRPVWQSLSGASVILDRSQVVDVTSKQIVVRDSQIPVQAIAGSLPEQT